MGEELDLEALQAQIDLSNSVTYDLVSSWMKPVSSKTPAIPVSSSIARELEGYAKRPPRLGLGASMTKASAATAREAAKLKGKLTGTKRTHDEGGQGISTSAAGQDEDNDEESRSMAISMKKIKLNGTGGLAMGRTKKNKNKGGVLTKPAFNGVESVVSADCAQPTQVVEEEEWHGFSTDTSEFLEATQKLDGQPPSPMQSILNHAAHDAPSTVPPASTTSSISDLNYPSHPAPSLSRQSLISTPSSQQNKLLNLDGPPSLDPESEDATEQVGNGSPKKRKRRRRRRKKKDGHNGQGE